MIYNYFILKKTWFKKSNMPQKQTIMHFSCFSSRFLTSNKFLQRFRLAIEPESSKCYSSASYHLYNIKAPENNCVYCILNIKPYMSEAEPLKSEWNFISDFIGMIVQDQKSTFQKDVSHSMFVKVNPNLRLSVKNCHTGRWFWETFHFGIYERLKSVRYISLCSYLLPTKIWHYNRWLIFYLI